MSKRTHLPECPLCENGRLVARNDHVFRFRYLKKEHQVEGLEHAVCDRCASSFVLPEQSKRNKTKVEACQRGLVGLVGPQDIRALREKYEITQEQAAKIFHAGKTAFSKWERGEVAPTGPTAVLLHHALMNQALMRDLGEAAGVPVTMPAPQVYPSGSAAAPERRLVVSVKHTPARTTVLHGVTSVYHNLIPQRAEISAESLHGAFYDYFMAPASEKQSAEGSAELSGFEALISGRATRLARSCRMTDAPKPKRSTALTQ